MTDSHATFRRAALRDRSPEAAPPRQQQPALRVLIVSYAFPPTGGAGVQRVLKLVKYLPAYGVVPSVLTVKNPSVPVFDESLKRELAGSIDVVRARSLEPSYRMKSAAWRANAGSNRTRRWLTGFGKQLLVPDAQVLWQPGAQSALVKRLIGAGADVVLISGPPFSQFLLGPVARALGAAVVFDYRDEWSTYRKTYEMSSQLAARAGDWLEPTLLRSAEVVTTATDAFRAELLSRFRFLDPQRVHAIPNGYDPEDFPASLPEPPTDRFVVTYAGTVFRLTSARNLIGALRRLHEREPELAELMELRFAGRIVDTELDYFRDSEKLGVRQLGYVDHARALELLAESHLVLCLLDSVPGAERIYPAKIFELMHLGRPCLTLAPAGALRTLVEEHRAGEVVEPRNEPAIAEALERRLRAFRGGKVEASAAVGIERYDRRALAGRFAEILQEAKARLRAKRPGLNAPQ